jgi:hypothetical protein
LIKDREIPVAILGAVPMGPRRVPDACPSRADPVRDTIRWERVKIPAQIPLCRGSTHQAATLVSAQTTVAELVRENSTLVGAEVALDAEGVTKRLDRKAEGAASSRVHPGKVRSRPG